MIKSLFYPLKITIALIIEFVIFFITLGLLFGANSFISLNASKRYDSINNNTIYETYNDGYLNVKSLSAERGINISKSINNCLENIDIICYKDVSVKDSYSLRIYFMNNIEDSFGYIMWNKLQITEVNDKGVYVSKYIYDLINSDSKLIVSDMEYDMFDVKGYYEIPQNPSDAFDKLYVFADYSLLDEYALISDDFRIDNIEYFLVVYSFLKPISSNDINKIDVIISNEYLCFQSLVQSDLEGFSSIFKISKIYVWVCVVIAFFGISWLIFNRINHSIEVNSINIIFYQSKLKNVLLNIIAVVFIPTISFVGSLAFLYFISLIIYVNNGILINLSYPFYAYSAIIYFVYFVEILLITIISNRLFWQRKWNI